jgi:hypothetical protein
MSGEVPLGGGGEVPREGIEGVFEGREDIDLGGGKTLIWRDLGWI